jgi:hypothetical protein
MDHFARVQFNDEESKERTEQQVGDREEVTSPDLLSMSAQEDCPVLPPWSSRAHLSHMFLDRAFAHANTQFEQLASNTFRSEDADSASPFP